MKNVPTSNDIRYHLEKYEDLSSLESDLNKAIQSRLPNGIRQGQQKVAIDFNLIPDYGEPSPEEASSIYKSKAKSGTCSFAVIKQLTLYYSRLRWQHLKLGLSPLYR